MRKHQYVMRWDENRLQNHIILYNHPIVGSLNVASASLTLVTISLVSGFDGGGGGGGDEGRTCG